MPRKFHVQLNAEICKASEKGDVWEIFKLVEQFFQCMNPVNLSTSLHRIAVAADKSRVRLDVSTHPLLADILKRINRELNVQYSSLSAAGAPHASCTPVRECSLYKPRCLATIAWACAKLQIKDDEFFHHVALVAKPIIQGFKTSELAKLVWALAKSRVLEEELMEAAFEYISTNRQAFAPVCLASLAWASAWTLVTFQWQPSQELIEIVVSTFTSKIDRAGPQEIANVCWALATARAARPEASLPMVFAEAFEIMGTFASNRLESFAVQELCSMSWAFGRVGYPHKKMITALAELLAKRERLPFTFHAQGLANILWAMAKMSAIITDLADIALVKEVALALLPACVRMVPRLKAL